MPTVTHTCNGHLCRFSFDEAGERQVFREVESLVHGGDLSWGDAAVIAMQITVHARRRAERENRRPGSGR